ncbi:hypothetical protein EC968_005250 [Mortierella alpina]|nr:hypothetical protein EC968_005250 [Mortierella alpina]
MLNHQAEFGIILAEVYDPALALPSGEVTPRRVQTAPESVQAVDDFQAAMREMRDVLLPEVDKLELTVVRPLQEMQNNMKLIRRTITKRDHKLLDYDRFRISLKKLQDKKERTLSDEKQIYKLESQLEVATSDYEGLNGLLREELPGFFYYKTQLIEPIFQSFFYLQLRIYNVMLDRMGPLAGSGYFDLSRDVIQGYEARKSDTEPTVESVEIITKRSVTATYTSKYGRPSQDADHAPGAYGAPAAMPNGPRGYSPPAPAAKPWQTGGAVAGVKPWETSASSAGAKPWQTGVARGTSKSPWNAGAASTGLNPQTSPPPPAYDAAQNGATTSSQQPVAGAGSRFKPPSNVHVHLAPSISGTIAATAAAAATSHAVNNFNASVNSLQAQAAHKGPPPPVPKRLGLRIAVALYDYDAQQEGDLSFRKDDRIEIVDRTADVNGWWTGRLNGRQGAFPDSVAVKDPYEEVFSLFTTETANAPWAHNRSVSQQASRLEVELDFTPAPSPTVSRPGSRPDSRTGSYFPSTTAASAECNTDLPMSGEASEARPGSGLAMVDTSSAPASPSTPTGSRPPMSATASAGAIDSGSNNGNMSNNNNNTPKPRNPAARALLGSRKSSRTGSGSGSGSPVRVATPQPKKPVVIHQSLSTLSQPGQTGTVVWDSSILMAKFMLSIKGLSRTCYRHQARQSRKSSHQRQQQQQQPSEAQSRVQAQREQIRRLEEQAERMAVADDGALTLREDASIEHPDSVADMINDKASDGDHSNSTNQYREDDNESEGAETSADDTCTEDDEEENASQEYLVFDPAETSILELGSGCGLLGIVMAELCQDLLLTDQKSVLPLLVKNLRKNLDKKYFDQDVSSNSAAVAHTGSATGSGSTPAGSRRKKAMEDSNGINSNSNNSSMNTAKPCHIQVQELVWGQDLDQDLIRGSGLDFIVATDVVYNESIVPKLVQTLKQLCEVRERARKQIKDGHGDRFDKLQELLSTAETTRRDCTSLRMRRMDKTVVLLAQELRTDYVHLSFLERLEKEGFRMVRMPKQLMDADYHSGYVVYALFLR